MSSQFLVPTKYLKRVDTEEIVCMCLCVCVCVCVPCLLQKGFHTIYKIPEHVHLAKKEWSSRIS
jgi:hypothetical protein